MTHQLEQYYPGDADWQAFVGVLGEGWSNCQFQRALLDELNGHLDLAKVVFALTGDESLRWVRRAAPALDGLSAAQCAALPSLLNRVRSMLMRMPI